jgi:hypothetical protein
MSYLFIMEQKEKPRRCWRSDGLRISQSAYETATDDHRRLIETPSQGGTTMPYENVRVADVEMESPLCWESEGFLLPETTIDLHTGSFETPSRSVLVYGRLED